MSINYGCLDNWPIFLKLILLTRFSQQGSLMSGGGQWANHVPCGCSRLIGISRRLRWTGTFQGDGQMEAPEILAESGCSDALF